jgi:hypothetical protein
MGRLRGILNDNSGSGTLYTNTDYIATANAMNIIASSAAKRSTLQITSPGSVLIATTGTTTPWMAYSDGILTKVDFTWRNIPGVGSGSNGDPRPSTKDTWIYIYRVAVGTTATANGFNLYVDNSSNTSSNVINCPYTAGDKFIVACKRTAPGFPGMGLMTTFNYYSIG